MKQTMICLLLFLISLAPLPVQGESDGRQVIERFSDQLLQVMKDGPKLGFQGRSERLQPAVIDAYDMPAMTKSAVGPAAGKLDQEALSRLNEAFTRYTVANYADQFDSWDGERFQVGQPRPSTGGNEVVPSQIIPKDGEPTEIDYLMHKDGNGNWKIIDVLLDGTVSQVAVRRSEFSSILRQSGPSGLVELLNNKTAAMASK